MHKQAPKIILLKYLLLFLNLVYCQDEIAVNILAKSKLSKAGPKAPLNSEYFIDQKVNEIPCFCNNGKSSEICTPNILTLESKVYENCLSCNKGYHLVEYKVDLTQEDKLINSLLTMDEIQRVLNMELSLNETVKEKKNNKAMISKIIENLENRINEYDPETVNNSFITNENTKFSMCLKNWCKCRNGHSARGELCKNHGEYHCAACYRNFQLQNNSTCAEIVWSNTATMMTFWLSVMVPFIVSVFIVLAVGHYLNKKRKLKKKELEDQLAY